MANPESIGDLSDKDLLAVYNAADVESGEQDLLLAEIERRNLDL